MRVLLISANTEQINMPVLPMGLASVAASLESAGRRVKMVNLMAVKDTRATVREAISTFLPDFIGVSVRNIDDQSMENTNFLLKDVKRIVSECKSFSSVPVIAGGAGFSIFPQSGLDYIGADMGLEGEGEKALPELLAKMEKREKIDDFPGLYLPKRKFSSKVERIVSLDQYPLPRPEMLLELCPEIADRKEIWLPVQTRRGCPMKCAYCSTPSIEGTLLRSRDPDRVVAMLSAFVETGVERFYFVDNTFNFPPSYAKNLCGKITAAGLNITCRAIVYPYNIDESLVEKMASAGFKEVALGFESGSDRMLRNFGKRFAPGDVRRASEIFKKFGIARMGFLLLGGPGETLETVDESLEFAESLELESMKLTAGVRIYPGTALARTAVEEKTISAEDNLLVPRFYMARELGGRLKDKLAPWLKRRPNWFA